jgi:hypothetical protein
MLSQVLKQPSDELAANLEAPAKIDTKTTATKVTQYHQPE